MKIFVFFCLFTLCSVVLCGEDFYSLLHIDRDSDDRTIRRAFKKLAMTYHPDKNQGDPDAHSKFVRINRAYEVLKDGDLRKRYDLYGEEGLKDDFHGGFQHQSWQFFKENFGIYDEDSEIITLNRADFEQSVLGSENTYWFINFYSPQCTHCHQLAPAWRLLARELDSVIRIGAVNCGDDFMLCQEQGIFSYPSLKFYPKGEPYLGSREKDDMVEYVLSQVSATILNINSKNLKPLSQEWDPYSGRPWILDFCDDSESCLSPLTRKKLSIMLDGLFNVGNVNCVKEESVCVKLGRSSGVAYFPVKELQIEKHKELNSFDAKELATMALKFLSGIKDLNEDSFFEIVDNMDKQDYPWLIHFVEGTEEENLELRKLPALLGNINCARLNCRKYPGACRDMHISKFPTFAVFKTSGGYEIHHGRQRAQDVASFAADSALTNVKCMGPEELSAAIHSPTMWFVDFFAPWCPPCMKLLPEFRKAAKVLGDQVQFGTVDCTIHQALCVQVNVHTYPTTILYNQTTPHSFVGLHSVNELLTFVEDIKNPPVVSLDAASFESEVARRGEGVIWLVDFFAPWCGPCQELAPEWRKVAKMMSDKPNIKVGEVDCVAEPELCRRNGINGYPNIRLYRGDLGGYVDYNSWFRNADSIRQWVYAFLPSKVRELSSDDFFNEVLNSKEPWLVDFFAPWCGHCQIFAPEFERVAEMVEGAVKLGKMNCDLSRNACQSAGVRQYPTVRFYEGADSDSGQSQPPEGVDIQSQDASVIVEFMSRLRNIGPRDEL